MQVDAGLWWVWSCLTLFYAARLAQHALHVWLHWQSSAFGLYLRPLPDAGVEAAPLIGAAPAKAVTCVTCASRLLALTTCFAQWTDCQQWMMRTAPLPAGLALCTVHSSAVDQLWCVHEQPWRWQHSNNAALESTSRWTEGNGTG